MWFPLTLTRWLAKPEMQVAAELQPVDLYAAFGDVALSFDAQANVTSARGDLFSLIGVAADSLKNDGLFLRIHISDRPAFLKAVSDAAHHLASRADIVRIRRGGASRDADEFVEVEMRCAPAVDGCVAILRDVSDARAREMELAKSKADVEANSVAKDRFLATISHELRTPLNAIIGFSEILGSESLGQISNERRCEYAKIIRDSGEHLLEIVNMLLDMSKLESGTFEANPESFDLRGMLAGVCDMMAIRAAQADVDLQRDFAADVVEIVSDRRSCRQILINLVNNAIKFTPPRGVVTVRAARIGGALDITVEDTGVGIAAADLPRLGSPFFQARSTYDRPYEGTGLGLSVVRRLAGLLGGAIVMESGAGLGTTVTVRLPLDGRGELTPGAVAPILTTPRVPRDATVEDVKEAVRLRA